MGPTDDPRSGSSRFRIDGQAALVVGAGGIGGVVAAGLAEAGADVAVADVDVERAAQVATAAMAWDGAAAGYGVDVSDAASVRRMVAEVIGGLGRIDVLVNAAGITHLAAAEAFPPDQWQRILEINLTGVFNASQTVGAHMLERGSGAIVNISSIAGTAGLANTAAYCASKGGVDQLTRAMALEWARRGVRVNAVAPSWFKTDMGSLVHATPGLYEERVGRVPMRRMGELDEIVGPVVFLASAAASMVTGVILPVDGGYLAQ